MSDPTPKEIRQLFSDFRNEWADIRDEAAEDMKAISLEGPWKAEDRDNRETAGRPCIHLDQINQYLNQTKGNVRKNKRGIQAIPKGDGANDQDAKRRSSLIMGIEEKSKAQPIYLHAFECMLERSYGFGVIRTEYRDDSSFDLDILIKPILNPDTVLLSPYYKQPDASDIEEAFLIDPVPRAQFKQKWPQAEVKDFSDLMMREEHMGDWITQKTVQVAEFWRINQKKTKLLLVEMKGQPGRPEIFTGKEWKQAKELGLEGEVKRERDVFSPKVVQYMTNGVEILDAVPWEGTRIPIISCLGPTRWTSEAGRAKRTMLSMVRFARDPQMLFDFLSTQECELAGMVPKVPYIGPVGAFETDKEAWEEANRVPHTYLQYDLVKDEATGEIIPAKPERADFSAPFQEYELAKDAATRHLQASMGISPLPDAAQRRGQKSGVALERIDDQEQLGAFQFVDRYENGFLHNMGWQINELITPVIDTERQMPLTQPDGSRKLVRILGRASHPIDEQGQYAVENLDPKEEIVHTAKGEFDVTIQTGPSYQSEREEQDEFVDTLMTNLANLPQPGTPAAKVLALGIRMRPTLGPIGGQIADVFDPPTGNDFPPEVQAVLQNAQAQIQQLSEENQALHMDRAGRVLEQSTKIQVERMKQETAISKNQNDVTLQQLQNDIKVLVALITAKNDRSDQELEMYKEFYLENHGAAHEFGMQQDQQAHDHSIADKAAENAQQLTTQQGAQQAALQEQQAQNAPAGS